MPQTDKALAELAQKLGVTVQYLWSALLAQQRVEGWFILGVIALLTTLAIAVPVVINHYDTDSYDYKLTTKLSVLVSVLIWVAIDLPLAYSALTDFVNPVFGAIQDLHGLWK
jgi:hypothetical protein